MALQKIIRYKRAFDLAQIESNLEEEEKIIRREQLRMANSNELRDNMCQNKCNENLQLGLDMVKVFR